VCHCAGDSYDNVILFSGVIRLLRYGLVGLVTFSIIVVISLARHPSPSLLWGLFSLWYFLAFEAYFLAASHVVVGGGFALVSLLGVGACLAIVRAVHLPSVRVAIRADKLVPVDFWIRCSFGSTPSRRRFGWSRRPCVCCMVSAFARCFELATAVDCREFCDHRVLFPLCCWCAIVLSHDVCKVGDLFCCQQYICDAILGADLGVGVCC
jgi:hypothetical protein